VRAAEARGEPQALLLMRLGEVLGEGGGAHATTVSAVVRAHIGTIAVIEPPALP